LTGFPVHYVAEKPSRYTRAQLVARLVGILALGLIGTSLGAFYVLAYVALPAFAAVRLVGGRDPAAYLAEDGPRILRGLRWFAAVYAWFGLVAEGLPFRTTDATVHVDVEPVGRPTASLALWRLVTGLPSALFLVVLCWVAGLVWLWAGILVLARQRVSGWAFDYLAGVQRWSVRLLAYQASLVDTYPPFSLAELPPGGPAGPGPVHVTGPSGRLSP
jgi:hypothetical protein